MNRQPPPKESENGSGLIKSIPGFQNLDPESFEKLERELEPVQLLQGQELFHQGEPGDGMYILLHGVLSVEVAGPGGEETRIDVLEPGASVGEIALLTGQPRSATVRGLVDAALVRLSKSGFDRLAEQHPAILQEFTRELLPRIQRPQLAEILFNLFGPVDAATLHDFQQTVAWRRLSAGEVLFHKGETGDSMYIVMNGRLKMVDTDGEGHERVIGGVGRGETVGEFALLTGEPRSATVIALRDTEIVGVSKEVFDGLLEKYPRGMLAITRAIIHRSSPAALPLARDSRTNSTFALLPASPGLPLVELAELLATGMDHTNSTMVLSSQRFDELFGKTGAAQTPLDAPTSPLLNGWLSERENNSRYLFYVADAEDTPWTRRCLSQADRILVVADVTADPVPGPLEIELEQQKKDARVDLVLIQPNFIPRPRETRRWLEPRSVQAHYHLRMNAVEDIARAARRLSGQAVGVVFSGGGARGFAHIGVIHALEEAGMQVDLIGGTSMGALVGGLYAADMNYEYIHSVARDFASPEQLLDYTLPYAGLVVSKKVTGLLQRMFIDLQIEDLWRPFFCLSTDLTRAEPAIHERGPLWQAVRASTAIPGIFTPLQVDQRVLVDGGVMNIFPVDIMRERAEGGPVIGVNASVKQDKFDRYDFGPSINGWQILLRKIIPVGKKQKAPSILASLMRSTEVNSTYHRRAQEAQCDLLICPPVEQYGSLDFSAYEAIITAGYEAAREKIQQWQPVIKE